MSRNPARNPEIPQEDWEQTPWQVKQLVESQQERLIQLGEAGTAGATADTGPKTNYSQNKVIGLPPTHRNAVKRANCT